MSKKSRVFIFILFSMLFIKPCLAQKGDEQMPPIDPTTKDYKYEEVVHTKDNASKSELYKRAKLALTILFSSDTIIIQDEDTAQGFIVAKVYSDLQLKGFFEENLHEVKLLYTITMQVKDSKYRYVIDNIMLKYIKVDRLSMIAPYSILTPYEGPLITKGTKRIKGQSNSAIVKKIAELKAAMETGTSGNLKKGW